MESEPLAHPRTVRQPIIPALHSSNCLPPLPPSSALPAGQAKHPQPLEQPAPLQASQSPPASINFLPFLQQGCFAGSAFMPTPFFPRSYFAFGSNPAHPGFALNWSQEYKCKAAEQPLPFPRKQ